MRVSPASPEYDPAQAHWRPTTRADCADVPRPCPYVGCRYHLYLEATSTTSLLINHPHLEPWEMKESCALDLAEENGLTLEQVGNALNITRERVRQIQVSAFGRLRKALPPKI